MIILDQTMLDAYAECDLTAKRLNAYEQPGDAAMVCQKWLRDTLSKRCIYEHLYGDLLDEAVSQRVLDVGGGLTSLTRLLVQRHDYCLAEILSHDTRVDAARIAREAGREFLVEGDWLSLPKADWDIVIANDLFPNVDQRLNRFIATFLPNCRELRLSLTWYDTPRHYFVRRLDGDEVFCFLAWDGAQLQTVLDCYADRVAVYSPDFRNSVGTSLYANGRQVVLVTLRGGLADNEGVV